MQFRLSNKKVKFFSFLLIIIGFIAFSIYFDLHEKISVEEIKKFVLNMGIWAPFVYILIYIVTSIIIFPNLLLSMAGGAIWGPYLGTVYTVIGASIGSILPFIIAKRLGRDFVMEKLKNSKIEVCDRFVSRNGFIAVLIVRLIPLFAWELVNYGSGLCGIRMRDYLLATFLGTIPASFTYNLIGSSLGQPVDKMKIILIFSIVSLIAVFTILQKVFSRKKTE
ncbi:MAG: TVP38/TMEM64 family inner membrane protein YdjZ [Chlamydiae bacterium]|nr:TVP38/TMEM64 family inner membrane protein YdjZ [Chlamydiota bacterium]